MTDRKTKYILRLANKMLKTFDGTSVQNLLSVGELDPRDYLFDIDKRAWVRVVDMNGLFNFQIPKDDKKFEMPDFMPPPTPAKSYTEDEYNELLDTLNSKLTVIEAIKSTREELRIDFDKLASEKINLHEELLEQKKEEQLVREELISSRTENIDLQSQISNLEKQVSDLLTIKDELLELKVELDRKQQAMELEISEKELSFDSYVLENEKLQNDTNELMLENEKLKKKMEIYKGYVKTEKKRSNDFESNISKLNQGIVKLKSLRKRDQTTIQNLENYKKTQSNKDSRELNRLIGDSFEIDNSAHWFIEMDGEVKGPFSFHDMKSLQKFNKINNETPVKKRSDTFWTSAGQDFELSANIITHSEIKNGNEVFRYFVNRSDYRAPFHGAAVIEIDGQEFTGFCTSLSAGGAFIELPELNEEVMIKGELASIKLLAGTLSQDLVASVIQRNFSLEKPCGIGLQFQGLDEEQEDVIISYVSSYLENSKKTA